MNDNLLTPNPAAVVKFYRSLKSYCEAQPYLQKVPRNAPRPTMNSHGLPCMSIKIPPPMAAPNTRKTKIARASFMARHCKDFGPRRKQRKKRVVAHFERLGQRRAPCLPNLELPKIAAGAAQPGILTPNITCYYLSSSVCMCNSNINI